MRKIDSNTCIYFYCIYDLKKIRLLIEVQSKTCVFSCSDLLQCYEIKNLRTLKLQ